MAQVVKLKRTAVSGKIPSTSNLELGELAINTYDGRIFFEKDSGTATISEILTTNTENYITGSLKLNGAVTASYINANGSGNSILVGDTLRIDENGGGLRMTNVGAFDNSSGNFRIFSNNDLILSTNGDSGTAVTFDSTTKDANFVGSVTASYFKGDGSQLTNVSATISENATVTGSFSNASSFTVNHSFETKNIIVSVYDTNDSQIIPQSITLTDNNNVQITLSSAQSGFAVVAKGGHIVSGSAGDASNLNGQPASYYLDYSNLNNIPSGIISSSTQIDNLFDIDGLVSSSTQVVSLLSNQDVDLGTGDITATTGSFDVIDLDRLSLTSTQTTVPPLQLTANSLQDGVGALRIDGSQADIFLNPSTATHTTVTFAVNNDQRLAFGMDNNSDFYITRRTGGTWYDDTLVLDRDTGEVTLGYDLTVNGNINATNGIVSGSSQITDLTTHKETVSGASSYAVTHNLNESYPIVQAWNTGTSQQEVPQSITTNSANQVTVVFSTTFAGVIIVKK